MGILGKLTGQASCNLSCYQEEIEESKKESKNIDRLGRGGLKAACRVWGERGEELS